MTRKRQLKTSAQIKILKELLTGRKTTKEIAIATGLDYTWVCVSLTILQAEGLAMLKTEERDYGKGVRWWSACV